MLVVVQKPGVDDGFVGPLKLGQSRIEPPANHIVRDVMPALGHSQPHPFNGHFGAWQSQEEKADVVTQCTPMQ